MGVVVAVGGGVGDGGGVAVEVAVGDGVTVAVAVAVAVGDGVSVIAGAASTTCWISAAGLLDGACGAQAEMAGPSNASTMNRNSVRLYFSICIVVECVMNLRFTNDWMKCRANLSLPYVTIFRRFQLHCL